MLPFTQRLHFMEANFKLGWAVSGSCSCKEKNSKCSNSISHSGIWSCKYFTKSKTISLFLPFKDSFRESHLKESMTEGLLLPYNEPLEMEEWQIMIYKRWFSLFLMRHFKTVIQNYVVVGTVEGLVAQVVSSLW